MDTKLVLNIVIEGENIESNPLLKMSGIYVTKTGRTKEISKSTPITSVDAVVRALNGLFIEP